MEKEILKSLLEQNHFDFLSIDTEKLMKFLALLFEKNKVMNLVGESRGEDLIEIHTRESLELFHALPLGVVNSRTVKVLDIGSGGGFPGIIIGLAKPDWTVHLVESIAKKANFLSEVISSLNLSNVIVHHTRAEEIANNNNFNHKFSLVMARGVGKYSYLYPLFVQFLQKNGLMVFWKKETEIKPFLIKYPANIDSQYLYPVSDGKKSILVLSL